MDVSIVIPFYNEEGNIPFVLDEVLATMSGLDVHYEVLCINDASRDNTAQLLDSYQQKNKSVKVLTHQKNRGQAAAFWTGFENAGGDVIITIDGDGQNDFRDVPDLLPLMKTYDAVFGQRVNRNDPIQKLIATRIARFFRWIVLNDKIKDTACGFKLFKKETLRYIIPLNGFHRFIPVLLDVAGFKTIAVPVNHRERKAGKSKYSIKRLYFLSTIFDLIFIWWYKQRHILRKD